MPLPNVNIDFTNGALGSVAPNADGVVGLAITGVPVEDKFLLNHRYILRSMAGLAALGITAEADDDNAFAYKTVREFYDQAGEGAELHLMAFANTLKPSQILDKNTNNAKALLQGANGSIRCLCVAFQPAEGYVPTITNGLDSDMAAAMLNGQALAEWATNTMFAPLFVILEGRAFTNANVANLSDLSEYKYNRVAVLIGDTVSSSTGAAVGLLAGRIAQTAVQTHIGRVRDGALGAPNIFIEDLEPNAADITTIHDKGFITFRQLVGLAGFYFSDDNLATAIADDFRSIARRRTIDKAYRIAHHNMLQNVNDNLPISSTGGISAIIAKNWENEVIQAVATQMAGELGADPDDPTDRGVRAFVDPNQNVVATGMITVILQVKPFGYAKFITVELGFYINQN